MSDFWVIDTDTYNKLQQLKEFVNFIAGLEYSTEKGKQASIEINYLIENINKPETF
jgi:hypothetical protein